MIASIAFWLWGILVLLIGFAIGYPALMIDGSAMFLILFGVWGIAYCLGGYALAKRRWGVRWWGTSLCVLSIIVLLLAQVKISMVGALINLIALGLIIASWKQTYENK